MPSSFDAFFRTATGKPQPYDYQCRLACGHDAKANDPAALQHGTSCSSRLINNPAGRGNDSK